MLKCFPLPHHKRMTTTSHCFLFWQYVIHFIQLTCWKANGSTKQARDDKWGAESLLAVVHPWCLPGSETQGGRYEWGDLPCGRQEGSGHQHGISIPAQLQDTALPDCFPSYSASESSNLISWYGQPCVFAYLCLPGDWRRLKDGGHILLNFASPAFSTSCGTEQALHECLLNEW